MDFRPTKLDLSYMQNALDALRRRFGNPLFLLALAAGLLAFAVQSGELGTSDTQHRLQSTHSFWTSEPPVLPEEYPDFGVHGRGGKIQSWYGIGQSLLMFPSDVAGTYLEKLPVFVNYNGNDPSVRNIFVGYSVNIFVAVLTALVCFRFLTQLKFDAGQAAAGTLALLLATTHLHYTQNMMENNYIFLLTLAGFSYQYEWLLTGSRRALAVGSAALGLNLLTRLTTGLDLLAGILFILLALRFNGVRGRALWLRCKDYAWIAFPVFAFFGLLDRLYQYYRFGSFFNTYLSLVAMESKQRDPSLPASYPFNLPFHTGFLGALFAPEKSVFLFDPLLVLAILLAVLAWRRFSPEVKAYTIAAFALLLAYASFYAKYWGWTGDFAWGDRMVSTAAQLAALLAVPLLLRHRAALAKPVWISGVAILGISFAIQLASLAFWLPLEIYQMETLGHPTFVVARRFENIAAFALGKMSAWGLNNLAMTQDPWDYVHITAWNFLPCMLQRIGEAPEWVVELAYAVWIASVAALTAVLWRLHKVLQRAG
jgi:hypothetical protein